MLGNLLNSVLKRKTAQPAFTANQVVRKLCLEFPRPALPAPSIHWERTVHLKQLANLATNALAGPVQEDKAGAYRFLKKIVAIETQTLDTFDLRELYGLNHQLDELYQYGSWEAMAQSPLCRQIRIISMRDYNRVLSAAVANHQPAQLFSTAWNPDYIYWDSTHNSSALIAALVYARRRELAINVPAQHHSLQIRTAAVNELQKHYHTLCMPNEAWNDPAFMDYLVGYKLPYVRFRLAFGEQPMQVIILPRNNPDSNMFGIGLCKAGAHELTEFLLQLASA